MKNFPTRIYVKIEGDGDDEFMHASDDAEDHAEFGKKVRVAEYRLRRTLRLKTVVKKR